ncbi:kinase-like domain-containing protein [Entophlyctis helioformis]|nr:kinase-like domain-containing protein [Entophlyctis helioformis]
MTDTATSSPIAAVHSDLEPALSGSETHNNDDDNDNRGSDGSSSASVGRSAAGPQRSIGKGSKAYMQRKRSQQLLRQQQKQQQADAAKASTTTSTQNTQEIAADADANANADADAAASPQFTSKQIDILLRLSSKIDMQGGGSPESERIFLGIHELLMAATTLNYNFGFQYIYADIKRTRRSLYQIQRTLAIGKENLFTLKLVADDAEDATDEARRERRRPTMGVEQARKDSVQLDVEQRIVSTDVMLHIVAAELFAAVDRGMPIEDAMAMYETVDSDDEATAASGSGGDAVSYGPLAPDQVDVVPVASTRQTGLHTLTLTDQVLGYGSHGTVVFKGQFENRPVAIKRMLADFYETAEHEARILQESDHHPNVIRYFVKEEHDGFLYIALELCQASLFDLVEKPPTPELTLLRSQLNHKDVLQQAMCGVQHLHSMQIVHRDIKPQNILIGGPQSKKDTRPRVLISDFGLGKRLADDHSSFTHTAARGGGTAGWRPREVLEALAGDMDACDDPQNTPPADTSTTSSTLRMSRAVDVFACGCVFYYVLSGGKHPFGNKLMCEANIMRGNYRLDALDALGPEGVLAKDVIRRMIAPDAKKRPDATAVLHHPFFWSASQRLAFLGDLSDRLESEPRDAVNVSPLVKLIERGGSKVTGSDWQAKMDASVMEAAAKHRTYDGTSVVDLLRALRNQASGCKHHFQALLPAAKAVLGQQPDGLLAYYETRFPLLLLHCYAAVSSSKTLRSDSLLSAYCAPLQ